MLMFFYLSGYQERISWYHWISR